MAAAPEPRPSNTRIERNGYIADIIISPSRALGGDIYHYIIQREGSAEVVHFGQEVSMQRAIECVDEFLDSRSGRDFPAHWG
jgi:hypothetical protein